MDTNFNAFIKADSRRRKISGHLKPQKLVKGHHFSSIPLRFHTSVISNSERKGFNSQSKRFNNIGNENPGPGFYNVTHQSAVFNNVSQSQKGTCFFPSLAIEHPWSRDRSHHTGWEMRHLLQSFDYMIRWPGLQLSPNEAHSEETENVEINSTFHDLPISNVKDFRIARQRIPSFPAANAYNIPPAFQSKKDFSLGCSPMFQQPIARQRTKGSTPAPNQYHVSVEYCKQSHNTSANAVFSSKTRRELLLDVKDKVPSPCHYRVKDTIISRSPTILVSCFKSRTSRETKPQTLSPGPAAYQQPGGPVTASRRFPGLRKYSLNFSAPPAPRPNSPPSPGPGQYEIVDYDGPPKHYISSAVFVSNTGRWADDKYHSEIPGPGSYNLPILRKQSFIYNTNKKWVPVL